MEAKTKILIFSAGIFFATFLYAETSLAAGSISYYQSVYDNVYQSYSTEFNNMAASGNGADENYYYFQYVLDGTLCMYEATKDVKYLERALSWAETMLSTATIVDSNGNYNWSGPWSSPYTSTPIAYQLDDLQGSTELARLARIIKSNSTLNNTYGTRATAILTFVKNQIIDKWLYTRDSLSWFYNDATQTSQPMNDKTALLMRILLDIYLAGAGTVYHDLAVTLANSFKGRFQTYDNNSMIWDLGVRWDVIYGTCDGLGCKMDTSHANRYPYTVIDYYKSGIVFTRDYVQGLANLLTGVMWDGSYDSPRFTNFTDGSNGYYLSRPPWNDGQIYTGWVGLGEFDTQVQAISDATLSAIIAGKSNPSLDYMNNEFGKMELAGHLAKNLALGTLPPDTTPPAAPIGLRVQ